MCSGRLPRIEKLVFHKVQQYVGTFLEMFEHCPKTVNLIYGTDSHFYLELLVQLTNIQHMQQIFLIQVVEDSHHIANSSYLKTPPNHKIKDIELTCTFQGGKFIWY
eukprot:TRINITY_DN9907_c1_g1_i1.p1 TRINITY_DN9907_c1_g1~~TRINITY_DN9907_c1_g1_i1.p1  ORF type:complete len:106 (-),score=4.21 TRINITY_DN9907_c1_g1_i1:323-640(-)